MRLRSGSIANPRLVLLLLLAAVGLTGCLYGFAGGGLPPSIKTVAPSTSKAGTTVALTISGTNLTGAIGISFIDPGDMPGVKTVSRGGFQR